MRFMIKLMTRKTITIENLAEMVQRGFRDVAKKEDTDRQFTGVSKRFDAVDERLDRIEELILKDHKYRIERLEGEMRELRELFAIK